VTSVAVVTVLVALTVACGGGDDEGLTVFAAASLTEVFERLDGDARFNFAGSDELATQLREGAEADLYAAASPRNPRELHREGLVERPRVFATNRLVLIVPRDNPADIFSLADLDGDVKLVVGAEGVPIGDYTRTMLENARRTDLLAQVVSEEEDVKGVLSKVALAEADAGFVYATDARAAGDDVRAIDLPDLIQVRVEYPIAVVRGAANAEEARAFVSRLFSAEGRRLLREAGFGPP
jgi:molybdate transport system substrate-binding protein